MSHRGLPWVHEEKVLMHWSNRGLPVTTAKLHKNKHLQTRPKHTAKTLLITTLPLLIWEACALIICAIRDKWCACTSGRLFRQIVLLTFNQVFLGVCVIYFHHVLIIHVWFCWHIRQAFSCTYTHYTASTHSHFSLALPPSIPSLLFLPHFMYQPNPIYSLPSLIPFFISMLSLFFVLPFCQFRVHGNNKKKKAVPLGTHGDWACAVIWQWHGKPARSAELGAHVCVGWTMSVHLFVHL